MSPNGAKPRFLGGYWRFVRRCVLAYLYALILGSAGVLALDYFFPQLQIFPQLLMILEQL